MQMHIDNLHQLIVKHPEATFFWRCAGDGMTHAGIYDGDILVIDRAVAVKHGDVVVAYAGGYVVRHYLVEEGQAWLYKDMIGEEDLAPISEFEYGDVSSIRYIIRMRGPPVREYVALSWWFLLHALSIGGS